MSGSVELCKCYRDADICLGSFFCPCIMHGCNERFIDERNDMGFLCCVGFVTCLPCAFSIPCIAWSRAKTRSLVGLNREPWVVDACASTFCPCCVLAQIARALRSVGYDGSEVDEPLFSGAPPEVEMER